jgi:hypothetical protein
MMTSATDMHEAMSETITGAPAMERGGLRQLSLVDLISRIVDHGDPNALSELHDHRTVFALDNKGRMRLGEYVDCLRRMEAVRGRERIAEQAYDLTITKFSRLPPPGEAPRSGTDCRNYFRPFVESHRSRNSQRSFLRDEYAAGQRLQGLVAWQFHLSLRECLRHGCPGMSRYAWSLPTGAISVMMPLWITGRRRREWLEANIPDADASRTGESQRVQEIVSRRIGTHMEALEDNTACGEAAQAACQQASGMGGVPLVEDVVEALAAEKAERKAELSPGFRRLPDATLKQLIHDVCDSLMRDGDDRVSAKPSWMNKVEFSRFAGTRWTARRSVPVLWANLAHLLASRREFVEAARAAGVWSKVSGIASRATTRRRRRTLS